MTKLLTLIVLLVAFSFGNTMDKNKDSDKNESFNKCIINDTFVLYQYDSYELNGDSVSVGDYIQTHKFYFTDSSVEYYLFTKTDTTKVTKNYIQPKEKWEAILKDFKGIDFRDIRLVWYIDWKNIYNSKYLGFTYDSDFYSYTYYKNDMTAITTELYQNKLNLDIPTKNVYTIYNIQGRQLYQGENLKSINDINLKNFGVGVFFVNITGQNFNKNIRLSQ